MSRSEEARLQHQQVKERIPQGIRIELCTVSEAQFLLVLGRHNDVGVSILDHIPHGVHCRRGAARLEEKVRMLELSATLVESPALAKDLERIVDGNLARSRETLSSSRLTHDEQDEERNGAVTEVGGCDAAIS